MNVMSILGVGRGVAVRLNVLLGGMLGVFLGVDMMTVGQVRMVTGLYVVPIFVVLCGFAVMARSVLMVLRCLGVMMCSFVWHRGKPLMCIFSTGGLWREQWSAGLQECKFDVNFSSKTGRL